MSRPRGVHEVGGAPTHTHARTSETFEKVWKRCAQYRSLSTHGKRAQARARSPAACACLDSSLCVTAWSRNRRDRDRDLEPGQDQDQDLEPEPERLLEHVTGGRGDAMRGAARALLQSCLFLLVRADQWRLDESASCDLNRKVSGG